MKKLSLELTVPEADVLFDTLTFREKTWTDFDKDTLDKIGTRLAKLLDKHIAEKGERRGKV